MTLLKGVLFSVDIGLLGRFLSSVLAPIVAFLLVLKLLILHYNGPSLFAESFLIRILVPLVKSPLTSMNLRIFHRAASASLAPLCLILVVSMIAFSSIEMPINITPQPAPETPPVLDAPNASSGLPQESHHATESIPSTPSLTSDATIDSSDDESLDHATTNEGDQEATAGVLVFEAESSLADLEIYGI